MGQSSPKKPKSLSPSRAPVEKTNLGARELNELFERELNRKKDFAKKVKSPSTIERKTMKQLKALAKPVLGMTAVETALKPTMTTSSAGKSKEKPDEKLKEKPVNKPKDRLVMEKAKERVDSPAGSSQGEMSGEEALVQESMIQAMLQQHVGQAQAQVAAALGGTSTGALDSYNPYASLGMHPMWSMYSPTFMGSTIGGVPMMDLSTAAMGYLPGMAGTPTSTTPSPTKSATVASKKQTGTFVASAQPKKSSQESVKRPQAQGKKTSLSSGQVKKSTVSTSKQGTKRPRSPMITLPSVIIPKLSLSDIPAAKKLATQQKVPSSTKTLKKPSTSSSHSVTKQQFSKNLTKQQFSRDLTQYEKATLPSGLSYLKPTSPPRAAPKPIPKSVPPSSKLSGATQPCKVTVYPIDMPASAYVQKQPPPAHGGSYAAARKSFGSGLSGLDFSKTAAAKPRPPSPPSDDDDVIILDDSD